VNLYTAFGYFEEPEDDRRVATNFVESLRPGGALVMEILGKEVLARIFRPRDWHEAPDGTLLLEERRVSSDWAWLEVRRVVVGGGGRREFDLSHRLYSAAELTRLVRECGAAEAEAVGAFDGRPYDNEAARPVVLGRR